MGGGVAVGVGVVIVAGGGVGRWNEDGGDSGWLGKKGSCAGRSRVVVVGVVDRSGWVAGFGL